MSADRRRALWLAALLIASLLTVVVAVARLHSASVATIANVRAESASTPAAVANALATATRARRFHATSPDLLELETALRLRLALANGESNARASAALLPQYRLATGLRPTWPYARANVANAKIRAGQFDAELEREVLALLRLGPWEPRLQLLAADWYYGHRQRFAASTQAALLAALDRAVRWQPHAVMDRGEARGQFGFLCARYAANSAPIRGYCELHATPEAEAAN
jgi:hypothetical protein